MTRYVHSFHRYIYCNGCTVYVCVCVCVCVWINGRRVNPAKSVSNKYRMNLPKSARRVTPSMSNVWLSWGSFCGNLPAFLFFWRAQSEGNFTLWFNGMNDVNCEVRSNLFSDILGTDCNVMEEEGEHFLRKANTERQRDACMLLMFAIHNTIVSFHPCMHVQ